VGKKIRAKVIITGRVQGVFFRYTIRIKAQEKGLTGWVRNLYSGEVESLFEGDEDKVKEMVAWCHKGPPGARVEKVKVTSHRYTGEFNSFFIA
jgi:acylphosphatase